MSGFVSRWPVSFDRSGPADRDALAGWLADVVDAVVEACPAIGREVTTQVADVRATGELEGDGAVRVAGGATEIFPESFVVSARFRRPGSDAVVNASCAVRLVARDRRLLIATLAVQALFVVHQTTPLFAQVS